LSDVITAYSHAVLTKPTEDPNYCIIKYSVSEKAGTLARALKVFFVSRDNNIIIKFSVAILINLFDHPYIQNLDINIIGVNTLNLGHTIPVKYKHNHVLLFATDEEVEELKRELLVAGVAFDVKSYRRIKHSDDLEALQLGNVDGKGIIISSSLKFCFNPISYVSCRYCSNSCLKVLKFCYI
jgi:hypothetical protein